MFYGIMDEIGITYPMFRHLLHAVMSVVVGAIIVALMLNVPPPQQHKALGMAALIIALNIPALIGAIDSKSKHAELGARLALVGIFAGQALFALAHPSVLSLAASLALGSAAYCIAKKSAGRLHDYNVGSFFDGPSHSMKATYVIIGTHAVLILVLLSVLWDKMHQL